MIVDPGFGHDFAAVRELAASRGWFTFERKPRPYIQRCLPQTYTEGSSSIYARQLVHIGTGTSPDTSSQIIQLEIGQNAVKQLQELGVAEITVFEGLDTATTQRALSLLAGNWQRLMHPGAGQAGLIHGLRLDHQQAAEEMANYASARLNGELLMVISKVDMHGQNSRMNVGTPEIRQLFIDLGLVPAERNLEPRANPIVKFDLLRVFRVGGFYCNVIQMPFELVLAKQAQ